MKKKIDDCIYHQAVSYHSPQQAAMFFATAHDLGYDPVKIKERAKKKFGKDCFNKLTKEEMKYLIDTMTARYNQLQYDKTRKENQRMGKSQEGIKG